MIPLAQKLVIGALGAICLSILKLIEAKFYIEQIYSPAALGAYLTYAGYIVLGTSVACFLCEEHPDAGKTRKSAFLMGLLAPSILVAITTQPIQLRDTATTATPKIKELASLLDAIIPSAHAQVSTPPAPRFETVSKQDVLPEFSDGIRAALGRGSLQKDQQVYVVGKTDKEDIALKTAADLNALLKNSKSGKDLHATILKPSSSNKYFVTVGSLQSPKLAAATGQTAKDAALEAIVSTNSAKTKDIANLLGSGDVVKGSTLFIK